MSTVIDLPGRRGGSGGNGGSGSGGGVSLVGHVQKTFLIAETRRRKMRAALDLAHCGTALRVPLDTRRKPTEPMKAAAMEWLALIGPRAQLIEAAEMFEAALELPARPAELGAVVAMLIDSFPNKGADLGPTYAESVEMVSNIRRT